MDKPINEPWRPEFLPATFFRPPEIPSDPMEFLSRSWNISSLEASKTLKPPLTVPKTISGFDGGTLHEFVSAEIGENVVSGSTFSFACSETSQLLMERIMSHSQEVSPRTSGRLSHSSGPLNGGPGCGSLSDSPPSSPSAMDDIKFCRLHNNPTNSQYQFGTTGAVSGGKTVGRWLKDRREKKKEETRAQNAHLHAAVTVAGVAAAIAAIAAATAAASSGNGKNEQRAKTDTAVASAATLVAAQCFEAAEAMGAEREHLSSVVSSAVNVRSAGDIMTLTAGAATALRGAATLKARALKEVWNIAAVIPVEKGMGGGGNSSNSGSNSSFSGELVPEENFLGICSRELLAKGCELLKRTRKGDLHWKIVSVYINRMGQVILKMKSRHVGGTFTKKKKNEVIEVCKDMMAWPGRHLLEGGEHRRYFGLKTVARGLVEFECRNQRDHDLWTQGVSRLLSTASERNTTHKK